MSRGIAATRHLFPQHCPDGGRILADLSYAEQDLRDTARRLSRHPNNRTLQNQVGTQRARRDARRHDLHAHLAACPTCAVAEGSPS